MTYKGIIYKYTFPDGKVYIGQTRRPMAVRHQEHVNPSTGPVNSGFWEAYQTVGEPEWEILKVVEAEDVTTLVGLLNRLETAYIIEAKATDPRYGYNKREIATVYDPDSAILKKRFEKNSKCWTRKLASVFIP